MPAPLILRSFLMKLGYDIPKEGTRKFLDTMKTTRLRAKAAKSSLDDMKDSAGRVMDPVKRLAEQMNAMFYASRLADSGVGQLKGISYASEKAGVAADLVEKLSINLASWRENNPGMIALIEGLTGIQTKGRAASDVVKELLTSISEMEPLVGAQMAENLGVDYETIRLWREFHTEIENSDKAFKELSARMGVGWQEAATTAREYANAQKDIAAKYDLLITKAKISLLPAYKSAAKGVSVIMDWVADQVLPETRTEGIKRNKGNNARFAASLKDVDTSRGLARTMTKAEYMRSLETKYGLPKNTLDPIWAIESNRGENTGKGVSSTGEKTSAEGHFQFIDDTAKDYGLKNRQDFKESADAAARLLRDLLKQFQGDMRKAITAYHAGPEAVRKYGPTSHMLRDDSRTYYDKFLRHQELARLGKDPGQDRGNTTIHQTNNTQIAVNESRTPKETAKEVGSQWNSVVRNNTSAFFPRG